MLGDCILEPANNVVTVKNNLACLLKLFGINLRGKESYRDVAGNVAHYADGWIEFNSSPK